MRKKIFFIALAALFVPFVIFAAEPLATSENYLQAIIPIALFIAIILFFAFLGNNY